jgi:hypothetical protein
MLGAKSDKRVPSSIEWATRSLIFNADRFKLALAEYVRMLPSKLLCNQSGCGLAGGSSEGERRSSTILHELALEQRLKRRPMSC